MTSEKMQAETRHKLREASQSLFACTDIDKRKSVFKVENVAAVLACTGIYYLGEEYAAAREARVVLCKVLEAHNRAVRPWRYPWLEASARHAARRVRRPVKLIPPRALSIPINAT